MIKKKMLLAAIFCLVTFLNIIPGSGYAQNSDSSNINAILGRLQTLLSSNTQKTEDIQHIMASMQPDGSWKGIDYQSIQISHWPALNHLSAYVLPMAKAYANPKSSLYRDQRLDSSLHKALDFWLNHNFTSQNWWSNDIGVPNTLTDILVLMNGNITEAELLRALNQMRGSGIDQTGQNKVWRAEIQLKIGLLEYGKGRTNMLGSPKERIRQASNILQQEVVVRAGEGIQPDWSFHQHGVQQQFGNYGLAFASTQSEWAFVLQNSPYEYSQDKIDILRNYILHGLSCVIWNGIMDISGIGRQVFPGSPTDKGSAVIHVLQLMAQADPEHAAAYQQVADFNLGKVPQPSFLEGNTYFWRSDLMVNRSKNSYISVRMCSKKIQSTESINGENLLGAYLSDGATYIYQTGKEYENIFPVWNWRRLPGITSYTKKDLPALSFAGLHNESDFVGGVSDSSSGVAAMFFKRNGLTAHKSWFFIPQGLVCLGAGIKSTDNAAISTTLNQSLLNGSIVVKTNKEERTITEGNELNSQNVHWVYHNHIGYVFLQKEKVHVSADDQKGNWKGVYVDGSPELIIKKVFNLWIDHGANPENASYAYMIVPNAIRESIKQFSRRSPVEILQNDTSVQAIQDSGALLTQAIFYHPGKITVNKKTILRVSAPCLLIAQFLNKKLKLAVSSPPELEKKVIISLNGNYECENCSYDANNDQTSVKFNLPEGINAGQSISKTLILK